MVSAPTLRDPSPPCIPSCHSQEAAVAPPWGPSPLPKWQSDIWDELWRTPGRYHSHSSFSFGNSASASSSAHHVLPVSHLLLPTPFPLPSSGCIQGTPRAGRSGSPTLFLGVPTKIREPPNPRHRSCPSLWAPRGSRHIPAHGSIPGSIPGAGRAFPAGIAALSKQETLALC